MSDTAASNSNQAFQGQGQSILSGQSGNEQAQQPPQPAPYGQPQSGGYGQAQQPPQPAPYGQPPQPSGHGQVQQLPQPAPYGQPQSGGYGQVQPPSQYVPPYGQQPQPFAPPYGQPPNVAQPYMAQPMRPPLMLIPGQVVQTPYGAFMVGNKSKTTAGLLGIFLGGFGAGQFYRGNTGLGIAQLAVSIVTFGFGALWGFIEGIIVLTAKPGSPSSLDSNRQIMA